MLKALGAKVAGTGSIILTERGCFGGAIVNSDGTNAAVVTVKDASGGVIFDASSTRSGTFFGKFHAPSRTLTYSVSGTGATAQFFEDID